MIKDRKGNSATRVCDQCGNEKITSYWNLVYKDSHLCYSCSNGGKNLGRVPYNKGKKQTPKCIGNIYTHSDGYPMVWVGKTNVKTGYMPVHRLVVADALGRELTREEKVHHINGDRKDYARSNLYLCESMSHHRKVHAQLEEVSMLLVREGFIEFDQIKGEYLLSRPIKKLIGAESGELLETPNEKAEGNQQPSSEQLAEKVQRLFQ